MAFLTQRAGSDWTNVYIRDDQNNIMLEDEVKWLKFSGVSWTNDSKGFFYSRYDAPKYKQDSLAGKSTEKLQLHKVFYHKVGTKQDEDVFIYMNENGKDEIVSAITTEDGKYLLIITRNGEKNNIFYQDISQNNISGRIYPKTVVDNFIGTTECFHNEG